jgi:hypothetical protein
LANALAIAMAAGRVHAGAGGWQPRLLHFPNTEIRAAVDRAVRGAARRLEQPDCQKVLSDFADRDGVRLAAKLEAKQMTVVRFLTDLRFVDGSGSGKCDRQTSAAFTEPGSLVIFVCGRQFKDREFSLQGAAGEVVIIHEILHALGLPENRPYPTGAEITAAVKKRCVPTGV